MSNHTPGPWTRDGTIMGPNVAEIDLRLDDEGHNWITIKGDDDETVEANARLIAAAPDLLRELKHLVSLLGPQEQDGSLNVPGLATLNGARAAIAKAKGDA